MTLPPLPAHLPWSELAAADGPAYTAAQMRDYARAAIAAHVPEAAFGNIAAVRAQPGIRTLSSAQIERHTLTASECPPDSAVMLVSSINRLLGKSRGDSGRRIACG